MVDYKLLKEMLEEALAKETSESWNRFLDDCHVANVVDLKGGDRTASASK